MDETRRSGTAIELAIWLVMFMAIFAHGTASTNLLIAGPVVLSLITLRIVCALIASAFTAVWLGLIGQ